MDSDAIVRSVTSAIGPHYPPQGFSYTLARDMTGTRFWIAWSSTVEELPGNSSWERASVQSLPVGGLARGLARLQSPLGVMCQALGASESTRLEARRRPLPVRLETSVRDPILGTLRAAAVLSERRGDRGSCEVSYELEGHLSTDQTPAQSPVRTASLIRTDR